MGWTKKQFVEQALTELGLASYVFDMQPEQMQTVAVRLDSMVAKWAIKGIRIGWPSSSGPDSINLEDDTECPDWAAEAIYTNLAIAIAPSFGKATSQELRLTAREAYTVLVNTASAPPLERQFPSTLGTGAGNKPFRYIGARYMPPPKEPLTAGPDSALDVGSTTLETK